MKKRTAFIGVILFLSTLPFLNDEVFGSSDFYQNYLAEFRPNPAYFKFKKMEKLFNKGLMESRTGDHKGAIETFSKFISKYSKNSIYVSSAYLNRALNKAKIGRHTDAIADYTEVIKINPNDDAYLNRGLSKDFLGDRKGACSDWREALKLGNISVVFRISQYCE